MYIYNHIEKTLYRNIAISRLITINRYSYVNMTDEHVINTLMIEEIKLEIKQTEGQAKVKMESCIWFRYQDKRTDEK